MIRLLADEDFDGRILRGLTRRVPNIDIVRVQDAGLQSAHDREILEWAARENRVVITHDVTTMSAFAYERITTNQPMPGIFEVPQDLTIGIAIEELVILAECSFEGEWESQVRFIPPVAQGEIGVRRK
ncbi:MAG: DUF5615 family PIN-like protein [Acidobacteria bacterium]|nr:DUF5615 family PIN-like protein [Acidobacteriota bacterium]